jgi:hypothetical protein
MLNIIWNKKNAEKRYGKEGVLNLEEALNAIKEAEIIDTTPEYLSEIASNSRESDSFLIIGGHKLFPFYEVENPARDRDQVVWTDNFYASTDDDPLLPERAIGRLPDGKDIELLIAQIHSIGKKEDKDNQRKATFGLSAAVWANASRNVYKIISNKEILLSPPENRDTLKISENTEIFYFNLHGSDRTNNWYGQHGSNYPIALSPLNIPALHSATVVTEACYGAYTIDKGISDSIALTFLKKGALCFVGSTTVAYGPPAPPSREADLIANLFFKEILKGNKFGTALLSAKQEFFRIMMDEQGFLDGNDKKTLLQFVLYGNPEGRFLAKDAKDAKHAKKTFVS